MLMDALYIVNNALHGVLGQINQGATGFLNGKGVLQDCGSRPAADQLGCDVGALLGAALELGGDDGVSIRGTPRSGLLGS